MNFQIYRFICGMVYLNSTTITITNTSGKKISLYITTWRPSKPHRISQSVKVYVSIFRITTWEYFVTLSLKPWFNNTSEMPLLDLSSGPKYVRHIYDYYLNGIALDFEISVLLIYDAPPPQPQQIRNPNGSHSSKIGCNKMYKTDDILVVAFNN